MQYSLYPENGEEIIVPSDEFPFISYIGNRYTWTFNLPPFPRKLSTCLHLT